MRFLEIDNDGEFSLTKNFSDHEIPNRYAILSHTWGDDGDEVIFDDMQKGTGIDKAGYQKLLFCAKQTIRDGLKYFWVDTCCINKSDFTELQHAINSMFQWYLDSTKCYVYLSDVSNAESDAGRSNSLGSWEVAFRKSRWFRRGWTLQELIAPKSVEFFSENHHSLGSKASLERQVCEITRIPAKALQGGLLSEFSNEEKMSWAEKRQTKYEEDKVYSLLGIFGVYLAFIYGEKLENALRRLNEEIEKVSKGNKS
jgi:hypothetical protein